MQLNGTPAVQGIEMRDSFANANGRIVVANLVTVITESKAYLSEIDGAIGDGDHGINMAKGFSIASERIPPDAGLSEALKVLGRVLMMEIGGSMGPLYGSLFNGMADTCDSSTNIDATLFGRMLQTGYERVQKLGNAKVGDKTLVDVLDPAIESYLEALAHGSGFADALSVLVRGAERGKDSTRDLVAKIGRAARLGERSRGVLDAGATSCWLILKTMGETIIELLET